MNNLNTLNGKESYASQAHLSDEELCKVYQCLSKLEKANSVDYRASFVRLLLGTGLRISEAINVKGQDLMWEHIPVVINVRNGKGSKQRYCQVAPYLAPHMNRYRGVAGWLFKGRERDGHISRRQAANWWREILELAGVRYLNPHKARHTFATWESEVLPLHKLKDKLGHSRWATTEQYYRHGIVGRDYSTEPPKWRELA